MSNFPLRDKCEAKAKELDCPHFTLLACDDLAIPLVRRWIKKATLARTPAPKIAEAKELVKRMTLWRANNPDKCKVPD